VTCGREAACYVVCLLNYSCDLLVEWLVIVGRGRDCVTVLVNWLIDWLIDWLSMVLRLRQHNIGYTADGFYRSDDPTNSVKALKEGG